MRSHRTPAPFCVLALVCLAVPVALGQDTRIPFEVQTKLEELKEAPAYARTEPRQALVELGEAAVDGVAAEITRFAEEKDGNYVAQCIIAAGELGSEAATDSLLAALGSSNLHHVYAAATSLGRIWAGKGGRDERAKQVNAELLALLYSDMPDVAVFGPALALIEINNIPIERPRNLTEAELREQINLWANSATDSLPPLADQPWQINAQVALANPDEAVRRQAIAALQDKRELASIEPIVRALGGDQSFDDPLRGDLGALVGQLSGVPFPVMEDDGSQSAAEQVADWRWYWQDKLGGQADQRHVDYSWRQLENAYRSYGEDPNQVRAEAVKYWRTTLLHQLPGADAIPGSASPKARKLLSDALEKKEKIAEAVGELGKDIPVHMQALQFRAITSQLGDDVGREVGRIFVPTLYEIAVAKMAADEVNQTVSEGYANVLSQATQVPLDLSPSRQEARMGRLKQWAVAANRKYNGLRLDVAE